MKANTQSTHKRTNTILPPAKPPKPFSFPNSDPIEHTEEISSASIEKDLEQLNRYKLTDNLDSSDSLWIPTPLAPEIIIREEAEQKKQI